MKIVQFIRDTRTRGGVSGVAINLRREWEKMGVTVEDVSIDSLLPFKKFRNNLNINPKVRTIINVFLYSIVGTVYYIFKRRSYKKQNAFIVNHGDMWGGHVYINHGLHRAMLKERSDAWKLLLLNPLHPFLLFREIIRWRLKINTRVICFAQPGVDEFHKTYPYVPMDAFSIIPNGINLEKFVPATVEQRNELRSENNIPADRLVLAFVGYEFERKGLYCIFDALKQIDLEVTLLVVGGQSTENSKAEKVAENLKDNIKVEFIGKTDDIVKYYQMSDIFVFPSCYETWGLVGSEAAACALPLLMTNTGAVPSYLKDGENGYFITREPDNIAARVSELAKSPELREKMAESSREVVQQFAWKRVAEMYVELGEKILNDGQ